MNTNTSLRKTTSLLHLAALGCATALLSQSAHAAFHLWVIQELFTNLDGSQQFIELFTSSGSQNFVGGQQIQVVQQGTGTTHTFTIPSNLSSSSTGGHTFLVATASLQAAGGPAPDYPTLPTNFLFANGGTINFFGANTGLVYTALPTDGVTSHAIPGNTNQTNSPKNFAGATSSVGPVPEPTTWALLGMGGVGLCVLMRRRAA